MCYKNIFLSILQNNLIFETHKKFQSTQAVCITTSYIEGDIMIMSTMAFKRVLKFVKTFVHFRRLQEENYFYGKKMFPSKKLTFDETLFASFYAF